MAPSNFGYSLREAGSHFFRNFGTSLGAVITIFLSLFIIGLFILGSAVVNSVIGTVEQQVTINAFISDDATDDQIEAFQSKLESWDNVASVQFKTKEDALADYTSNLSNNAEATMAALDGENPLPRSFVIEMQDPSQVQSTAERIKADEDFRQIVDDDDPDVDDVDADVNASVLYGQEEVGRLFQVTTYIRIAAVVLVALLTFIAFIFINNTIRLSITARAARSASCASWAPRTASSAGRSSPRASSRRCWARCCPSACSSSSATSACRRCRTPCRSCRSRSR